MPFKMINVILKKVKVILLNLDAHTLMTVDL